MARAIKYMLKNGKSLAQYCKENGIIYDTIMKRMIRFDLTPDQAIKFKLKKGPVKKLNVEKTLKQIATQEQIDFDELYQAYEDLKNPKVSIWKRLFQW